jgi:C_GCAxxG_C_C family probable redox protein
MKKYDENKAKLAGELFMQGYNCSQSVIAAWADEIGLDRQTALLVSSGFGGGMGRLREVCGAVSGAFMVLSYKFGSTDVSDRKAKAALYETIQDFAARFKQENRFDSIVCRDMLGLSGASAPTPAERTAEYYKKRPCRELIELSSGLLGEFIGAEE